MNNLKQLGLALHNYHDTFGTLPSGYIVRTPNSCGVADQSPANNRLAPWTVLVLPFIEQDALHDQFDFNIDFSGSQNCSDLTSGANATPSKNTLSAYQCPSHPGAGSTNKLHYEGVQGGGAAYRCARNSSKRLFYENGVLYANSKTRLADLIDGTSNVLMLGETNMNDCGWAHSHKGDGSAGVPYTVAAAKDPINIYNGCMKADAECGYDYQSKSFGSFHPGGAMFVLGDASVHFLSETMDTTTYQNLGIRNDALPVGGFSTN
ncbi:DUF1559 domain-containing protein [Blastopirellula sp. J2-11]|nr:DUF1559 domain-containing protein [Blastopirellula sp. J2-11]